MRLKTPLSLSLALLLGAIPSAPQASPGPGTLVAAAKKKKPAAAPVQPPPPVEEPLPQPLPPPEPPALPALPATPWAGRTVVLAVPATAATAADALDATRLEGSLNEALVGQANVFLLNPVERFPAPPPLSLERGDVLYNEGKGLYDNLDPEGAAKKFTTLASYYQRLPVDTKPERLARVYIFLGASRLLDGDTAGAQKFFTRAVLAEPNVKPESELFGQDVDEAFTAAKTALASAPRGTLAIDSVPQGAQVTVHGESLGTTPLKDVELPPGPHQVVITLPGHLPFGTFQEVASGQRAEVRPTLAPVPGLGEFREQATQVATSKTLDTPPAGAPPAEIVALGQKIGARYVVLARVEHTGPGAVSATLDAWDVQGKNRLRGVKWNPASATEQQRVVRQVNDFVTGRFSNGLTIPPEVVAVVKKPWFWAAVGGVAVATTAGILLANQGGKPLGARLGNFGAGW
ncbi:PEGA domain-containing protein [Cystobacter fuscus]|uniref:PEGA domain-containing protein n=1 Tax=Cystobacter fuscus TaxID=43 RepID=UPI002B2F8594|nr:PEGA domain-containing protein [Cystobacter fuscus]